MAYTAECLHGMHAACDWSNACDCSCHAPSPDIDDDWEPEYDWDAVADGVAGGPVAARNAIATSIINENRSVFTPGPARGGKRWG